MGLMGPRNAQVALLASATKTATNATAKLRNRHVRGVLLLLNVSAASGTGGLTVRIRAYETISGNTINLLADTAAITATGTYGFLLHPNAGAAADGIRVSRAFLLSQDWDVQISHGDASNYTYSLSAELLP